MRRAKGICIGVMGCGRAGKDTFAAILGHLVKAAGRDFSTFAFATALKSELDPFFRAFGGTAFETDTARKNLIRPILVSYGCSMRDVTNGRRWIEQIDKPVRAAFKRGHVVTVTDVRFATHAGDEAGWIKSLGGTLVYIERIQPDGKPVPPANPTEAAQDPVLRAMADYTISWPTVPIAEQRPFVETFWREISESA